MSTGDELDSAAASASNTPAIGTLHSQAEALARRSYGKLMALLAAQTRDVAIAEDALSEAFATALSEWPKNGCPANPEAWILTVARRKWLDSLRKRSREAGDEHLDQIAAALEIPSVSEIPDRRLALMFACAHPAIETSVRAPLILQVILGVDAKRIASAFLVSPAAMAKRLVRAKEKIRVAGVPFRIPERDELPARLGAVLDAIYAAFAEGWTDPSGSDSIRHDLKQEALFLARVMAELFPEEPEVLGLLAMMLHAEARRRARRNREGEYVHLADQDQSQWDLGMIEEAERLILQAMAMGRIGRYQLEAAIQSAHVHRCRTGVPNWGSVLDLYTALAAIAPSPVVTINRALAICQMGQPRDALAIIDEISSDVRMKQYQPYWAARAELLARCGEVDAARHAYDIAIGLEHDPAVRRFLQYQQSSLDGNWFE